MTTKSKLHESYERAAGLAARLSRELEADWPDRERITANEIATVTTELLRLADRLSRYAEAACNYGLSDAQEKRVARLEARIRDICKELRIGVTFNGDPRGYVVRLKLPSGDYNTWGGKEEGWGI